MKQKLLPILAVLLGLIVGTLVYYVQRPGPLVANDPSLSDAARRSANMSGNDKNKTPKQSTEVVTKQGTITCLKHANATGPQTMECAIGLELADGTAYGLQSDDPTTVGSIPTGETVTVTGTIVTSENTMYATLGTIRVNSITRE